MPTNPSDHDAHCPNHEPPRPGFCTALTMKDKRCNRRVKVTSLGFAPFCGTHQGRNRPSGNCRAVEVCGQPCNRLIPYDPPYYCCKKHHKDVGQIDVNKKWTGTTHCGFKGLPTELRIMVFRYLFPETVCYSSVDDVEVAILEVNRQIYLEASSVLYGETPFEVLVEAKHITFQGKTWGCGSTFPPMNPELSLASLRHIRNLHVEIRMGKSIMGGMAKLVPIYMPEINEQAFYMVRKCVHSLVNVLTASDPISRNLGVKKKLTVRPEIKCIGFPRADDDVMALFFVLEPFQALRQFNHAILEDPYFEQVSELHKFSLLRPEITDGTLYGKLKEEWLKSLQAPTVPRGLIIDDVVERGFNKLQNFFRIIHKQDSAHLLRSQIPNFGGIEKVVHLGLVAYEHNDSDAMKRIHEAIKMRWIDWNRLRQKSSNAISQSIKDMSEPEDCEAGGEMASPRELYPDVFDVDVIEPTKPINKISDMMNWADFDKVDDSPDLGDPDVKIIDRGLRRHIRKDGRTWVRLMTPFMINGDRKWHSMR